MKEFKPILDYLVPSTKSTVVSVVIWSFLTVFVFMMGLLLPGGSFRFAVAWALVCIALFIPVLLVEWGSYIQVYLSLKDIASIASYHPEEKQLLLDDFKESKPVYGDEIRVGKEYYYGHETGIMVPRKRGSTFGFIWGAISRYSTGWIVSVVNNDGEEIHMIKTSKWSANYIGEQTDKANNLLMQLDESSEK